MEVAKAGEVDHTQRDSHDVADDQAKQDRELADTLGGKHLKGKACHKGHSAQQEVVPGAKVLRAATTAKARSANAEQREADRRDDASSDDRRDDADPVLGKQTQHALKATAHDDGAQGIAVAHGRAHRAHGRDKGEAHAHDDGKPAAYAPHGKQLDERTDAGDEHRRLDEHRRVLDAGCGSNDGNRCQVGDKHRQNVLDAIRDAGNPGDLGVKRLEICG